jgi:hypothetical protein
MAIARAIGSFQLNDRVNTFWDHLDWPGTRRLQIEQLVDHDGEIAVVRVDRVGLVMTAYFVFEETDGTYGHWIDWLFAFEGQWSWTIPAVGVPFHIGDGRHFSEVWCDQIVATQRSICGVDSGGMPLRVFNVSMKVTSRVPYLAP